MMMPTHVLAGLVVSIPVALLAPEFTLAAVVGGAVGGVVPDVDLFVGTHRKTLHFPVLGIVPAVIAVGVALLAPSTVTVGVAVGLVATAIHAGSDVLGAGEELRPWERTNTDAVYCHLQRRWLQARYVIPYDGSPRDLMLTGLLAVPVVTTYDGVIRWATVTLVVGAGVYGIVRKRIPKYVAPIVE